MVQFIFLSSARDLESQNRLWQNTVFVTSKKMFISCLRLALMLVINWVKCWLLLLLKWTQNVNFWNENQFFSRSIFAFSSDLYFKPCRFECCNNHANISVFPGWSNIIFKTSWFVCLPLQISQTVSCLVYVLLRSFIMAIPIL